MISRLSTLFRSLLVACVLIGACDSDPASTGPGPSGDADTSDAEGGDAVDAIPDVVDDPATDDSLPDLDGSASDLFDSDPDDEPDALPPPSFLTCMGRPLDYATDGVWNNPYRSEILEELEPGHSVVDLIVTLPPSSFEVEGKFAYGDLSIDLESERITAFVDDCTDWIELGLGQTDSDGRVTFEVPQGQIPMPGRYEVRMFVEGDGTTAAGNILVVPPESRFVVFDIDGTLTTGDSALLLEIMSDLFGGDLVPDAYDDADAITQAYASAGYLLVYLTGRSYWLDDATRTWLSEREFPVGTLHFTRTFSEVMPNDDGVGAYKRDYLRTIVAEHGVFRAYGNATTDIFGYREAGISTDDIYIIGEHAGEEGTQPISDYPSHLGAIEIPPAEQPWEDEP